MQDLENAGRMIAAELAQHGIDLGAIEVRQSALERVLLIKPAAWTIAIEHRPEVDRPTMTPTTAMQIANTISVHTGVIARVAAMRDAARHAFDPLKELADGEAEVALKSVDDMMSDSILVTLSLHASLHDNVLRRTHQYIPMDGLKAAATMKTVADNETRRQRMVADAGSRVAALRICSVAAAWIRSEPETAAANLRKAFNQHDIDGMRDGTWTPRAVLGPGVRWRRDTLIIEKGLPHTLQSAIIGRQLSEVVTHPWLPADAVVHWTNQRINEELYIHAAPRTGRPNAVEDLVHVEPLAPLLEELGLPLI